LVVKARGTEKAISKANYDKILALTILRLKNGDITDFEGQQIGTLAISVMESIAKGYCWQERLEMEKSEALYKSALTYVDVTTTQLQGYQSVYRHLDAT
jgi:hypothetical protein